MKSENHNCETCIWCDQCGGQPCEDYSPINDDGAFTYYQQDLADRAAEYLQMIRDYADNEAGG